MKCASVNCPVAAEAAWRVQWPGKPVDLCDVCAAHAIQIADAMGFPLTVDMLVPQHAIAVLILHPPPGDKAS